MKGKSFHSKDCIILVQMINDQLLTKAARDFLRSPYFRVEPKSIKLFESLLEVLKSDRFDEKKIWQEVDGGKRPYSYGHFRVLLSRLQKKLEEFLAYQEVKNDPYLLNARATIGLQRVGWPQKALDRLTSFKEPPLNEGDAEIDHQYSEYYRSILEHNFLVALGGAGDWKKVQKGWNLWSTKNALQIRLNAINLQKLNPEDEEDDVFQDQLLDIANNLYPENIAIQAYILLVEMRSNSENVSKAKIQTIIDLLKQSPHFEQGIGSENPETDPKLNSTEWQSLFVNCFNVLNEEVNTGNEELFHETAELYEIAFQKGLLSRKGTMQPRTFFNYVQYQIKRVIKSQSEYSFAQIENFIENQIRHIPSHQKAFCYPLAKATVAMAQNHFEDARRILASFKAEEILWEAQRRWLLVKLSFLHPHSELDEKSEINKLRLLLARSNSIPKTRARIYRRFLELLDSKKKDSLIAFDRNLIDEAKIPEKDFFRQII